MVNVRPNIDPAARYSVTEACVILGIHRNTLARCHRLQDTQGNWQESYCRGANHSTLERNHLVLFIYSFLF